MKEYRVELLVAIAIITIFSGLLLSAVLTAKRKTAMIQGASVIWTQPKLPVESFSVLSDESFTFLEAEQSLQAKPVGAGLAALSDRPGVPELDRAD